MKRLSKIITIFLLTICVSITVLTISGFNTQNKVSKILDNMFQNEYLGIFSHPKFYIETQPELYNEIISMGEDAIGPLLVDFTEHQNNSMRQSIIINILNNILEQNNLSIAQSQKQNSITSYLSCSEWFEVIGKDLYKKYVGKLPTDLIKEKNSTTVNTITENNVNEQYTILRGKEFEFVPGTYIPEPIDSTPPEDGIKWEPRLGCYILENIYYDEINEYFYIID